MQGLHHLVQITFHDQPELVERQVDAVVGQATLREVVGADAVAAIPAADQPLAFGRFLGGAFAAFLVLQAGLQHLQGLGLVAVLAASILAFRDQAGGQVHHAHGRVGLVDVLTTGAAGAKGVDAQVGRVEGDGLGFIRLRHHRHCAGAGVDAALAFRGGHALHPMASGLESQPAIGAVTDHPQHQLLVATQLGRGFADGLDPPALALGIAGVHACQVASKQGRFIAPGASPDFKKRVAPVIGIARHQQGLQFGFQRGQIGFSRSDFVFRQSGHLGVVVSGQGTRIGQVGFTLQIAQIRLHHRIGLGMFPGQLTKAIAVVHGIGCAEECIQFMQAQSLAFQRVANEGLHETQRPRRNSRETVSAVC